MAPRRTGPTQLPERCKPCREIVSEDLKYHRNLYRDSVLPALHPEMLGLRVLNLYFEALSLPPRLLLLYQMPAKRESFRTGRKKLTLAEFVFYNQTAERPIGKKYDYLLFWADLHSGFAFR